jgi:hypothetical protein
MAIALALAILVLGCGGTSSGALGYVTAPAGFDPNGPRLSALDIAFDRTELHVPVAVSFVLVFENREQAPHNVSVYRGTGATDRVFEGVVFGGPGTRWYPIPALAPGTYFFQCDVHPIPAMQGTLIVP